MAGLPIFLIVENGKNESKMTNMTNMTDFVATGGAKGVFNLISSGNINFTIL